MYPILQRQCFVLALLAVLASTACASAWADCVPDLDSLNLPFPVTPRWAVQGTNILALRLHTETAHGGVRMMGIGIEPPSGSGLAVPPGLEYSSLETASPTKPMISTAIRGGSETS